MKYDGRSILYICCSLSDRCFTRVTQESVVVPSLGSTCCEIPADGTREDGSNQGRTVTHSICQLLKLRFPEKPNSNPRLSVSLLHNPNGCTRIAPHDLLDPNLTADLEAGGSGAAECLDGEHLVVEVAGREAVVLPSSEVVGDGDSAAGALVLTDREVLAESAGALDGRLVDLGVLADLVGRAVAGDAADGLGAADRARVVAVVLHDVVLCVKVSFL